MTKHEITYLTDIKLLTCIVQSGLSEIVIKAARDVGAVTGAISHHARGSGARERLGVLGIAVEAEKDVINILASVNQCDLVYDAIYRAAELDVPGRGFIYLTALEKASTYIPESIMERLDKDEG